MKKTFQTIPNDSEQRHSTDCDYAYRNPIHQRNYMKLGSVVIYAFCKNCFPDLAQGYSSNNNFVNCSEISAVTPFGICLNILKIPTFAFFTPP